MNKRSPQPFKNYAACCEKVIEMKCSDAEKKMLRSIALTTQCPSHPGHLKNASMLAVKLGLLSSDNYDVARIFLATFSDSEKSIKAKVADYPVCFGLQYIFTRPDISDQMKCMSAKIFVDIFALDKLQENDFDPDIFQNHVYSCRSILSEYSKYFLFQNEDIESFSVFRKSILAQCSKYLKNQPKDSGYYKIKLLYNLLTNQILPGQRQKKKTSHSPTTADTPAIEIISPDPGTPTNSSNVAISYPSDDSQEPKTLCRDTPKSGSRLSRKSDRHALRGRLNNQAARNVVSITDMHRLPLPCIVGFLSSLDQLPEGILCGWMLLTTGLAPKRLLSLQVDPATNNDCLALRANILRYQVHNRPDEENQFMLLQTNPLVRTSVRLFQKESPFLELEETMPHLIKKFSTHFAGQSPTLERISSSSALHFSNGFLNEFETAYLAGDIPAKLRAQVHYYPVDLAELNRKWQNAHQILAKRILSMESCTGRFRSFLQKLEPFPEVLPEGIIGSAYGKPVTSLQHLFHAIEELARQLNSQIRLALSHDKLPLIVDLIQVQHLQLYLIEQLCFGSRKFGTKTQYALALSRSMGWGSEKASAVFSVERKTIPLVEMLQSQVEVCESDWRHLVKEANARGVTVSRNFHKCCAPLPAEVTFNTGKRQIDANKMSSSGFSDVLEKYDLPALPPTTSKRVHLFKHIVAGELVGKVPQVLLDELLSHDRDGLDFCAPWSTGSAVVLDQLSEAIQSMLSQLNIHPIVMEWHNV